MQLEADASENDRCWLLTAGFWIFLTIFWHTARMPNEHAFASRQADQARTDFAAIESNSEFLMRRIAQLTTAADLWRATMLIAFVAAVPEAREPQRAPRGGRPRR